MAQPAGPADSAPAAVEDSMAASIPTPSIDAAASDSTNSAGSANTKMEVEEASTVVDTMAAPSDLPEANPDPVAPATPQYTASGRPSRRAARAAVKVIHNTVAVKDAGPKVPLTEEEQARRVAVKEKRIELVEKYEQFLEMFPKKKKKGKGRKGRTREARQEIHAELAALRRCQHLPAVAQFMFLYGKLLKINPVGVAQLEQEYQDPDSVVVSDMNAKLLRKILNRDDIIYNNWLPAFLEAAEEEDDDLDLEPYQQEYQDIDVTDRVEITHMLACWAITTPDLRETMAKFTPSDFRLDPIGRDAKHAMFWDFGDLRLYRELPGLRNASYKGKAPAEDAWDTACVTAEEWSTLARSFAQTSSKAEKSMFAILKKALPAVLAQLQKDELEEYKKSLPLSAEAAAKADQQFNEEQTRKLKYMEQEQSRLKELTKEREEEERQEREEEQERQREAEERRAAKAAVDALRADPEAIAAERRAHNILRKARERAMRDKRAKQRELELAQKREHEERKRLHLEKVRQFRKDQRAARAMGLPPPEMPPELKQAPPSPPPIPPVELEKPAIVKNSSPKKRTTGSENFGLNFEELMAIYKGKRLKHNSGKFVFTTRLAEAASQALATNKVTSMTEWHMKFEEARRAQTKRRAQINSIAKQKIQRAKKREAAAEMLRSGTSTAATTDTDEATSTDNMNMVVISPSPSATSAPMELELSPSTAPTAATPPTAITANVSVDSGPNSSTPAGGTAAPLPETALLKSSVVSASVGTGIGSGAPGLQATGKESIQSLNTIKSAVNKLIEVPAVVPSDASPPVVAQNGTSSNGVGGHQLTPPPWTEDPQHSRFQFPPSVSVLEGICDDEE